MALQGYCFLLPTPTPCVCVCVCVIWLLIRSLSSFPSVNIVSCGAPSSYCHLTKLDWPKRKETPRPENVMEVLPLGAKKSYIFSMEFSYQHFFVSKKKASTLCLKQPVLLQYLHIEHLWFSSPFGTQIEWVSFPPPPLSSYFPLSYSF